MSGFRGFGNQCLRSLYLHAPSVLQPGQGHQGFGVRVFTEDCLLFRKFGAIVRVPCKLWLFQGPNFQQHMATLHETSWTTWGALSTSNLGKFMVFIVAFIVGKA